MTKEEMVYQMICEAAGIQQGLLNGKKVNFTVQEKRTLLSRLGFGNKLAGQFRVDVYVPYEQYTRVIHLQPKDGTYQLDSVVKALFVASHT